MVTIIATGANSRVIFDTNGSTFAGVMVQADDGIEITKQVTTTGATTGMVHLDGDADRSSDSTNKGQAISTAMTVTAKTVMTLQALFGTIIPAGTLTFKAESGILIMDHLTGSSSGSALVINADSDTSVNTDGTLTVSATKTETP